MNEFEENFDRLLESIVKAAHKIKEDPKAEQYIRSKIKNIWYVGKEVGKMSLTDELFNQNN